MNFHVLTLFPEMIENGMNTSITGRAITKGLLTLEAVNIRDYAFNKHQKVDDYTYGGGLKEKHIHGKYYRRSEIIHMAAVPEC